MVIRVFLIVALLTALPGFLFAQESGFPAEDYASADRCGNVLLELGMQSVANPLTRSLVSQACITSRLEDRRARLAAGEDATKDRGIDLSAGNGDADLNDVENAIKSAREERDRLFKELSQIDPHEANELLKRLLGPNPDKNG